MLNHHLLQEQLNKKQWVKNVETILTMQIKNMLIKPGFTIQAAGMLL